jgi:hypothetical protein
MSDYPPSVSFWKCQASNPMSTTYNNNPLLAEGCTDIRVRPEFDYKT